VTTGFLSLASLLLRLALNAAFAPRVRDVVKWENSYTWKSNSWLLRLGERRNFAGEARFERARHCQLFKLSRCSSSCT
jgi:hypothetical protein